MQRENMIHFRNMHRSEFVCAKVNREIERLQRFFPRITSCDVVIDVPERPHHRKGAPFHVRVDISVPGRKIIVNPHPRMGIGYENLSLAIHDAFGTASRRLRQYAERHTGKAKHQTARFVGDRFDIAHRI